MRKDVQGTIRVRALLSKKKGYRERKTVRGNTIAEDIIQINLKVIKEGEKKLEEIFGEKVEETSS